MNPGKGKDSGSINEAHRGRCKVEANNMMKNVSYALPLLGKFSRVDAMSHWYKATEICRGKKKKAAEHTFLFMIFFFWKQPYTFMQISY